MLEKQVHTFKPIYTAKSKILILGTFPSVKSREQGFYYGHPQNRFWKVLAAILQEPIPNTIEEKTQMLLKHHIALWDVAGSCEIEGSSDSSMQNVVPNPIEDILKDSKITKIFANGKTAQKLYEKLVYPKTQVSIIALPSTSPANAAWHLEELKTAWAGILKEE